MIADHRIIQAPRGTYNLLLRATGLSGRRPEPPREVRYESGFIRFSQARDEDRFALYAIRIDRDSGPPDIVVPAGTRIVAVPSGTRAWVTTVRNGIESAPSTVPMTAVVTSGAMFEEITMAPGSASVEVTAADGSYDGQLFFLQINNNAAGDAVFTWGPNFEAGLAVDLSAYNGSINRWIFAWKQGEWRLWSAPYLGF